MTVSNEKGVLTSSEKFLLKKMILDASERPIDYQFSRIYRFYNYDKHSENEIRAIVKSLIEKRFLYEKDDYYSLTRESFLKLKQQYWLSILIGSQYARIIFPAIAGGIFAIVASTPLGKTIFKKNEADLSKSTFELRIDSLEKRLSTIDTFKYSKISLDSGIIVKDLLDLRTQYSKLLNNVNSLNLLLQNNPTRFIEIATMKKDIEDIKQQVNGNNESLKRDVDRISTYNNTLIVFMITFLVAYIGIGVFNIINKTKNSEI